MTTRSNPTDRTTDRTGDGIAEQLGDERYVLRFERRFAHPVDRVWDALTRPERIVEWFGEGEVKLDLVEGGAFDTRLTGPPDLVDAILEAAGEEHLSTHDQVLRVEAPVLFEHTFGAPDSIVRWELEADGDGCVLSLTHTLRPDPAMGDLAQTLAGWHVCLDLMERSLAGSPQRWNRARWETHRARYAA